ncbi:unnamed protein product [Prorocentrum cordatum]|uniref:Uncharacterized protein n=1 Tax=Prorocentrum cordatum TaxID=2364126 RepID=A0ABN9SWE9_9DINO|nr:unnamed protein product [Polarella glacialis]
MKRRGGGNEGGGTRGRRGAVPPRGREAHIGREDGARALRRGARGGREPRASEAARPTAARRRWGGGVCARLLVEVERAQERERGTTQKRARFRDWRERQACHASGPKERLGSSGSAAYASNNGTSEE